MKSDAPLWPEITIRGFGLKLHRLKARFLGRGEVLKRQIQ
jgi:hypothetical protein